MADITCPICGSINVEAYAPDDGDYQCSERPCQAKFIWPQPPPPATPVDQQVTDELAAALPPDELAKVLDILNGAPNG